MRILQTRDFFLSNQHAFSLFDMNNQTMEDVHGHEFDELVIVRSGSGFHIINDHVEFIYKGDFFLVSSHDIHCYESTNKLSIVNLLLRKDQEFHFIKDVDTLLKDIRGYTTEAKGRRNSLSEDELSNIDRLVAQVNAKCDCEFDACYFSLTESIILTIIVSLYQCINEKKYTGNCSDSGKRYLLNYLRDNYTRGINWGYLCEESGVTKRTMFRFIKSVTGYTPEKFQSRFRLLKTQELLRTSDHSVGDIAIACGFLNTSRLTESYKKQFHRTPSQERARVSNSVGCDK